MVTQHDQQRAHILTEVVAERWSIQQAAVALGLSPRQVWRLKQQYQCAGIGGLLHGNRGRPSPWKTTEELQQRVLALMQAQYAGCNDSHLAELLAKREGILLSRETLGRIRRQAGLSAARPRRAPRHRRRRERASQAGMLLQIDGSRHRWLGPEHDFLTLLGAIDDATGRVLAAVFRDHEDSHGYFLLLRQIIHAQGLPQALYHDRHSIFVTTHKLPRQWTVDEQLAGRQDPTQFARALEELAIASIAARSPQAKGRIERLWGTLQDRLVVELRLADISTPQAANAFLPHFLNSHNQRFMVHPDEPGQAYRPLPAGLDLDRVLSFRYPKIVANDNTVRLDQHIVQIPPGPRQRSYARAQVWLHQFLDGSFGVWYHDAWLARTTTPAQIPNLRARRKRQPATPAPAPTPPAPSPARPKTPWKPSANHIWKRQQLTLPKPPLPPSSPVAAPDS